MLHRLCEPPSIPLSFSLATILPRRSTYCISVSRDSLGEPPPSAHRLRHGLPGYLIPFAPHAFAPQRQKLASVSPSPPVFLLISTHFTAPPGIPHTSPILESASIGRHSPVGPGAFTSDLADRLRALYAQ
jgi:hypothetical protein